MIFLELSLEGHRYEYLKNLYNYACKHTDRRAVFVVPSDARLKAWEAEKHGNVVLDFLAQEDVKRCSEGSLLKASWQKAKLVRRYVDKYQASHVFLIFLMLYMPALLLLLPKGVTVSGIVYRSFLWEDSLKQSRLRKWMEWLRYWYMARSRMMIRVLMLNDSHSADTLNKRLHTSKFVRLPDPYTPLDGELQDVRALIGMGEDDRLFITIGQLDGRKSVIETLDAIDLMTEEDRQHRWFYFAGRVSYDIKQAFYDRLARLKEKGCHVFVKDEFVSFEFLNSLCASCDCILVPYRNTCQSSGCIGYAAQYGKSVIGPSQGLLGHLIRHYGLGDTIDEITPTTLHASITHFRPQSVPDTYVRDNRLEDFLAMCCGEA